MTAAVTVGLPVFNGERYLGQTLESLLAQSFTDFEILVSDNGSTDGTEQIARAYAQADRRVRFTRHPTNRGAAWNYSHLVGQAGTPYFKWSGHDDLYDPAYLGACVSELEGCAQDVALCYPRTQLIDADGCPKREYDDGLDLRSGSPSERLRSLLEHIGLANAVFGVIRTAALRRTRLIAPYNDSDIVLLVELALIGRFHELPETLFERRMHAGQAYQANRSARDVSAWFDPAGVRRFVLPRGRRFVETARAIARADLALVERARCEAILLRAWGPKDLYHTLREVPAAVRGLRSARALA